MRSTRALSAIGLGLTLLLGSAGIASANSEGHPGGGHPGMSEKAPMPPSGTMPWFKGHDRNDHDRNHGRGWWFFGWNGGYPDNYAYGDVCRYDRYKWRETGSRYWLRRYETCLDRS